MNFIQKMTNMDKFAAAVDEPIVGVGLVAHLHKSLRLQVHPGQKALLTLQLIPLVGLMLIMIIASRGRGRERAKEEEEADQEGDQGGGDQEAEAGQGAGPGADGSGHLCWEIDKSRK